MTERYDCHYCKESLFGKKYVLREENPYCVKCYESLYSNNCERSFPGVRMTERYDCHYCKESLFGKKYVLREENPYCVKCYESLYSNNCEECKKPIGCNSKDLSYKDRHWHEDCFHCFQCKRSLVDKPFSAKEEQLLCTECYSNEYSSKCHECKKTIMPGTRKMEHKGNSWHETCFICQRCQQPIGTKSFIPKDNQNYCVPCYEKQFAMQCVQCKKVGTRKMEHKGNSWHETCFICQRCQQPIGTKSFIPKDNQNYCVPCYEKQFAMQCVQCKKPITTGGVTYRDQPWHKDCFLCTGCKNQLSGQRFTSRDDFPYCLNCFCNLYAKKCAGCTNPISGCKNQLSGQRFTSRDDFPYCLNCFCNLYAKKCAGCTNPISGIGGSKYISFEERQWHNDCFNCKKCSVSLVGRGFLAERDDVLCPECGKDI
ncbi:UNVERIFIED_CONTAM: hypothetical protein FKN15_053707 [Acipenser sinensis]